MIPLLELKSYLRKIELAPVYSSSAILIMAAQEWRMAMEFLARTEPMMMASLSVQLPSSQRGIRKPLKNAPGLNRALRIAWKREWASLA